MPVQFGQEVVMVGSAAELGSWDANASKHRLTWSQGHIWRIKVPRASLPDCFEFKFVIRASEHPNNLVRWEGNPNH